MRYQLSYPGLDAKGKVYIRTYTDKLIAARGVNCNPPTVYVAYVVKFSLNTEHELLIAIELCFFLFINFRCTSVEW